MGNWGLKNKLSAARRQTNGIEIERGANRLEVRY